MELTTEMRELRTISFSQDALKSTVVFNRTHNKNSINMEMVEELAYILDVVEQQEIKILILTGQGNYFCTGMDMGEYVTHSTLSAEQENDIFFNQYMELIKRISLLPCVVISLVNGHVTAGGMGIIAVSDYVIAAPQAQYHLSEALFGLIPAMIVPYLIRKIGFQPVYYMALTTLSIDAEQALKWQLINVVSEHPEKELQPLLLRVNKIDNETLKEMKRYFRSMWMITEGREQEAVEFTSKRMSLPKVRENISNYYLHNKFPWD